MCFVPGSHLIPVLEHTPAPHMTYAPVGSSFFDELQLTSDARSAVNWETAGNLC